MNVSSMPSRIVKACKITFKIFEVINVMGVEIKRIVSIMSRLDYCIVNGPKR